MDVDASLALASDTSAAIRTAGILGDQFIALEPGAEEDLLVSGDELSFSESAFNMEKLVGTLVHDTRIGDGK
jgi:phospholipid/cholesterol/gamma-HCH transport system substrate-binding protein